MSLRRLLALSGVLVLGGCLYHARERVDQVVCDLGRRTYDPQPAQPPEPKAAVPATSADASKGAKPAALASRLQAADHKPPEGGTPAPALDLQTTAFMQADNQPPGPAVAHSLAEIKIPPEVPGSEVRRIQLPDDPEARQRTIRRIYPKLPPLPEEPKPLPGPDGKPYTLADLQHLAAANSPSLRQAASDVEAARGALIQARAYPNPTVSYLSQPSSDGSTSGVQGFSIDQVIVVNGKLKLAAAAAAMDLRNAELALRRARSDLATQVRNAYFAVLVAKETVRVNRGLAHFTDEVYRWHTIYLAAGLVAPYEPAALRALAYTARLSSKQSIQTYIYSWQQLVAALGLRQLPLSEVAGRVDAVIPYFDFDAVRAYVLRNHTDVLTARNGLDRARYNLKLAQITPYPNPDVNVGYLKDLSVPPKQFTHTVSIGIPLPVWDQNKGNILSAEAALVRATEEPHRVEESLTTTLATAYMGYKNNLEALEHYRRFILPDQVRTYLGVIRRRHVDPSAAFADLVTAQQTLAADVAAYLGILSSLWSSVVSVADLLQTDDLFQLGQPRPLPTLPDLEALPSWPCCHDCPPAGGDHKGGCAACPPAPVAGAGPATPLDKGQLLPPPTTAAPHLQGTGLLPPPLAKGANEGIGRKAPEPADLNQDAPRSLPAPAVLPPAQADEVVRIP
jgi:cobalt-zinc-cadmium efflux system outer membrane protein